VYLNFAATNVYLEVRDDGVGFDPQMLSAERWGGLRTMAERTERVGGKLTFESAPQQGTRVNVKVTL
jgi:signal transduction histidine kinase